MLVLTRKVNQQIRLGDDITVTILRVQGNSIRIGVEAPRSVRVVRGELEPLNEGNQAAANATNPADDSVSSEAAQVASASGMLEFDLDDVDAETLESLQQAADQEPQRPRVYQMRTAAPLARFLPPQSRESTGTYSV